MIFVMIVTPNFSLENLVLRLNLSLSVSWRHILMKNRSDEGLMFETSAFLPFTVANLRFQLSCH